MPHREGNDLQKAAGRIELTIGLLVWLLVGCCTGTPGALGAQQMWGGGARIRLLEQRSLPGSTGDESAASYSVRELGRVEGAVQLAVPEAGGHLLVLTLRERCGLGGRTVRDSSARETPWRRKAGGRSVG